MPYANSEKRRLYHRAYRKKHAAYLKEKKAAWHHRNYWNDPDTSRRKGREAAARYYSANPERFRQKTKDFGKANPEKVAASCRAWKNANPEKVKEMDVRGQLRYRSKPGYPERERHRGRTKYRKYRAKCLARGKAYARRNAAQVKIWKNAWYMSHKDRYKAYSHKRRAMKRAAVEGDPKAIQAYIVHLYTAPNISCHWCRAPLPVGKRTIDHFVPLARHGKHSISNLVPACAFCNTSKGAKLPHEFTGQFELFADALVTAKS